MTFAPNEIVVYTDGSCHTQIRTGAWVAIIWISGQKKILQGTVQHTTHHRMELTAVLEAFAYIKEVYPERSVLVITDSQYVTGLINRETTLLNQHFKTKAGNAVSNADLISRFYNTRNMLHTSFVKIKAHRQNADAPYNNREADLLCRRLVRLAVNTFT